MNFALPLVLSQVEIAALHVRAMNFICKEVFGNDLEEITIFYRSKPPQYWQSIQLTDGIMRPYIKDSTGHPGSPINGKCEHFRSGAIGSELLVNPPRF